MEEKNIKSLDEQLRELIKENAFLKRRVHESELFTATIFQRTRLLCRYFIDLQFYSDPEYSPHKYVEILTDDGFLQSGDLLHGFFIDGDDVMAIGDVLYELNEESRRFVGDRTFLDKRIERIYEG